MLNPIVYLYENGVSGKTVKKLSSAVSPVECDIEIKIFHHSNGSIETKLFFYDSVTNNFLGETAVFDAGWLFPSYFSHETLAILVRVYEVFGLLKEDPELKTTSEVYLRSSPKDNCHLAWMKGRAEYILEDLDKQEGTPIRWIQFLKDFLDYEPNK
jgi:hypothetical protein